MTTVFLEQMLVLAISAPLQLALVPFNEKRLWFTPGELRFWSVVIFVIVEIVYLAAF